MHNLAYHLITGGMDSTSSGSSFNLISIFKEKFLELSTHFLTTKHK